MTAKALQAPVGLRVANGLFVAVPWSADRTAKGRNP